MDQAAEAPAAQPPLLHVRAGRIERHDPAGVQQILFPRTSDEFVFRVHHLAPPLEHLHLAAQGQDIPFLEITLHVPPPLEPLAGDVLGIVLHHQGEPGPGSGDEPRLAHLPDQGHLLAGGNAGDRQDLAAVQIPSRQVVEQVSDGANTGLSEHGTPLGTHPLDLLDGDIKILCLAHISVENKLLFT